MAYLGSKSSVSINMDKITAGNRVRAFWIDPKTGKPASIGSFSNTGVQPFSTPDEWEDAVLIVETTRDSTPTAEPSATAK